MGPSWQQQYDENMTRQKALAAYLRAMGDPRLGGVLPLGGKAAAGSSASHDEFAAMQAGGMNPPTRTMMSGYQSPMARHTVSYPANLDRKGEGAIYDHLMNLKESELEDMMVRARMLRNR